MIKINSDQDLTAADMSAALALADKRLELGKKQPRCGGCGSKQMQLTEWIERVVYKCRKCKKTVLY